MTKPDRQPTRRKAAVAMPVMAALPAANVLAALPAPAEPVTITFVNCVAYGLSQYGFHFGTTETVAD